MYHKTQVFYNYATFIDQKAAVCIGVLNLLDLSSKGLYMCNFTFSLSLNMLVRDRLKILLLALSEFKQINYLLFPLKFLGNFW